MRTHSPILMEQHLSVREACEFTGKSESTIKRLIREVTGEANHPDRGFFLPSAVEVERRKKVGDPFVWKLNQEFLARRFPKATAEEGSDATKKTVSSPENSQPIIEVLREQLQSKDRQLVTLETQLDRKDEQIKSLNERMHESNVLMRELQSRLAITAPVKATSDVDIAEKGSDAAVKATVVPDATKDSSKSSSFFGRLFRKSI